MITEGFILTSQIILRGKQNFLRFYLAAEQQTLIVDTDLQDGVFFAKQSQKVELEQRLVSQNVRYRHRPLALATFSQEPVDGYYFSSQKYFHLARQALESADVTIFEDDIRLVDRYLMERYIRGSMQISSADKGIDGHFQNARCKPSQYRPALQVLSLDIECSELGELYSVGLVSEQQRCVIMINCDAVTEHDDYIHWVDSEMTLLMALVEKINQLDPDVIIGWNVVNFDFRILIARAEAFDLELLIGRDKSAAVLRQGRNDNQQYFISIAGRVVVDGIDALKTGTYQFTDFKLQTVAEQLLGYGKLVDDPDQRLAKITHDFNHNKVALAEYNLQDCQLVLDIFEKTRLMEFLVLRSQITGLALDKVGGSVAAFTNLYLPQLHRAGYIAPNLPDGGGLASPGGYVMESLPGLYNNILVLDFKSLYPSIIRTFKIDPLGLIEGLLQPEHAIEGFKAAKFSREKHFLPKIVADLWRQRDIAKAQGDEARSRAIKIIMNSMYGVLGSGGCRFYDTRLASSITLRGHQIMKTTAQWIEAEGHQVIYGDTDSTFVKVSGSPTTAHATEIGRALAATINEQWQKTLVEEMQLECFLEIEFETCFKQFFMPTIRGSEAGSKKRYVGIPSTSSENALVFKGMENVRSDWTELAKQFQASLYQKVFAGHDVSDYINKIVNETRLGQQDDLLVYKKRLRRPLSHYVKNVPPHVKAARLADQYYQSIGKAPRYQNRGTIKYVITTAGPQPLEHVISPLDYEHYIFKQLAPVAEAILPFVELDFYRMITRQLNLF